MSKKMKTNETTKEINNIENNETKNEPNNQIVKVEKSLKETENIKKQEEEKTKNIEIENKDIKQDETATTTKQTEKTKTEKSSKQIEEKKYNNYEANIKSKKRSKKGIIAFSIILILILILALFSTIFSLANLNNIRIIDGVIVKGISLKGLTKEEAKAKLTEEFTKQYKSDIKLEYNDYSVIINGEQIKANYNIDELVEEAHKVGRSGDILQNNYEILQCLIDGKNIEPELEYEQTLLDNIISDINAKLPGKVTNYSYYIEDGKLIIIHGKEGVIAQSDSLKEKIINAIETSEKADNTIEIPVETSQPEAINIEKIHSEIYVEPQDAYYTTDPFTIYPHVEGVDFAITMEEAKNIISQPAEEYTIPLKYTTPEKTTNKIGTEAFPDLLSSFSTKYDASNKNRSTNLQLASNKINGTILLPGEEFSYNKVVGERTIAAGYKEAHIFSGGKVVDGLGGGICQISSTLYNTVLYANLEITERRNHQLPAGYVKNGLDATVVYGSIDFKFVNNRKYPIKIVSQVKNGVAKMDIYGVKEEVEYEVKLEPVVLSYTPYKTEYVTDTTLKPGQQVVVQNGANGCKTVTYKYLLLNGNIISKTEISRDTYKSIPKIVKVGP